MPGLEGLRYVRALAFSPQGQELLALCNQSRSNLSFSLINGGW